MGFIWSSVTEHLKIHSDPILLVLSAFDLFKMDRKTVKVHI